jgi:hypothetical protein
MFHQDPKALVEREHQSEWQDLGTTSFKSTARKVVNRVPRQSMYQGFRQCQSLQSRETRMTERASSAAPALEVFRACTELMMMVIASFELMPRIANSSGCPCPRYLDHIGFQSQDPRMTGDFELLKIFAAPTELMMVMLTMTPIFDDHPLVSYPHPIWLKSCHVWCGTHFFVIKRSIFGDGKDSTGDCGNASSRPAGDSI